MPPLQPLQGLDVVLTRPVASASALAGRLRDDGARCVNLPLLSIRRLPDSKELQAGLAAAERADALVFASPNAVRACYRLRPRFRARGLVFAQGPATARALRRHAVTAIAPADGFTTEALLLHPFFASVAGKHVVRVAGIGGRDLLQQALAAKGARVDAIALYARVPARWQRRHRELLELFADPVLVLSSSEGLQALMHRLEPRQWRSLRRWRILASSARLEQAAIAAGFERVHRAASAASADLRAGLLALTDASQGR